MKFRWILLFFVLFIAPILFNDGKRVPKLALWKLRGRILLMALGLVFFTVVVIGYLIHWLIPSIPLSAAFALAAILSPTDIVAVSAMSNRVKIPKETMHLLEGEGLLNDASGLVSFKFAIAATVTGVFHLSDAVLSFLEIDIGGFAGGALLAFLIVRLKLYIRRLGIEDVTLHTLIQILTPFVIFLAIEHFNLSGILAVVAAGIVYAIERDKDESPMIQFQIVSRSTWTILLYVLNGLVFLLLGMQIPYILHVIYQDPDFNVLSMAVFPLIISAGLFAVRFLWLYAVEWIGWVLKKNVAKPEIKTIGIATISGVRGAVTLAGAFSIPYVLSDGSLFPERNLIIFIAAGVILITLVLASVLLPIITRTKSDTETANWEQMENRALYLTHMAAIRAVREAITEANKEVAASVLSRYNSILQQLELKENGQSAVEFRLLETEIRMKALQAQSRHIAKLTEEKRINMETALLAQLYVNRMEAAVTNRIKFRLLGLYLLLKRILFQACVLFIPPKYKPEDNRMPMGEIIKNLSEVAIQEIRKNLTPENKRVSYMIIGEYLDQINRIKSLKSESYSRTFSELERELKAKAFQAERDELQRLYENGEITKNIAQKIRQQINIREAFYMEKEFFTKAI